MTNKIYHEYRMPVLHKVFMVSSVALMAVFGLVVMKDYNRPWKKFQREFRELQVQKTTVELNRALSPEDLARKAELEVKRAAAQVKQDEVAGQIASLKAAAQVQIDIVAVQDAFYKSSKGLQDALRYRVDKANNEGHDSGENPYQAEYDSILVKTSEFKAKVDEALTEQDRLEEEIKALEKPVRDLEDEIESIDKAWNLLDAKLASLTKRGNLEKVKQTAQNIPLLDFIQPTYKIDQLVINDLYDDYNFTLVPKVDRCRTCHTAIDVKGFEPETLAAEGVGEDVGHPYLTHPRLDLYVYSSSKHPASEFGCTTCHSGSGQDTSFWDTHHTPSDLEEQEAWEADHDWSRSHYWDFPMFSTDYIEASCYSCHATEVKVEGADKMSRGVELIRDNGCWGCHKIENFEDRRKEGLLRRVGPSLKKISSKTNPDWLAKWIMAPKSFRPSTRMPSFWSLEENAKDAGVAYAEHVYDNRTTDPLTARNRAEVEALTAYLVSLSETDTYPAIPVSGDAQRGTVLFEQVGCLGCHTFGADTKEERTSNFGPDLAGLGSKVEAEWLFAWIQDPKAYWPETTMPDLRLSDQEAADITAFLMLDTNSSFEALKTPEASDAELDSLTRSLLRAQHPPSILETKLSAMSRQDKLEEVGKRMVANYGCFGCHEIQGYEDAQGIGTELSQYGNKDLTRLDAGLKDPKMVLAHMAGNQELEDKLHERSHGHAQLELASYIKTKIMNPRVFDEGRTRSAGEKLKMPFFGFSDEEAEAIVTAVMGMRKSNVMDQKFNQPNEVIEKGRWLVRKYNCTGCHIVEGEGGDIRKAMEATEQATYLYPPDLATIGHKLRPEWFYNFLRNPGENKVRPWLNARMPSFDLTDEEWSAIITYFNAVDEQVYPYQAPVGKLDADFVEKGKVLFDTMRCMQCHPANEADIPRISPDTLAPNFALAHDRLKPDWIARWVGNPMSIVPDTRMPQFWPIQDDGHYMALTKTFEGDEDAGLREIEAVRDYILSLGK